MKKYSDLTGHMAKTRILQLHEEIGINNKMFNNSNALKSFIGRFIDKVLGVEDKRRENYTFYYKVIAKYFLDYQLYLTNFIR